METEATLPNGHAKGHTKGAPPLTPTLTLILTLTPLQPLPEP